VKNSSVCNITVSVGPGEMDYDYRCSIARHEWRFVDDYNSLVTQVSIVLFFIFLLIYLNRFGQ